MPDPRRRRRACDTPPRRAREHSRGALLALSAALALLAGCGGGSEATSATAAPELARSRAAVTAAPAGASHGLYAQNGFTCDACHPCGKRSPDGHAAAWMDQADAGFHAFAANSGIASCQTCHGAALDGVGGSTSVSCAQCHGAGWKTDCTMCHGGEGSTTGAPPRTSWGKSGDAVRVGAHAAHVGAAHALAAAIDCGACHVKPTDALSPGHADGGTATVTFSGIAARGVVSPPAWDRAQATCASTYCHGATLSGGSATSPVWTRVDGSQRACDACHGAPPPAPHPSSTDCAQCHPGYTATSVNAATHVDGKLDVVGLTCTSCHGTAGINAAPPVGVNGDTATTAIAVGAHQAHLAGGTVSSPIACAECHVVPTATDHANGLVELEFGPLSTTAGAAARWDRASGTCASVYCHGQFVGGNLSNAPSWTTVNGSQDACGTCHGVPPAAPHVQSDQCGNCHTGYTRTTVALSKHVNGKVDVNPMTCASCHGSAARTAIAGADANETAAPPVDSKGNTAVTARGVGVHVAHVNQSTYRSAPIACSECHFNVVPTTMNHANGTVAFAFGTLAKNASWGGVTPAPAWNGSTCASTYCHGAFKNGATATVTWTAAGALSCTSCHGSPPAGGHPASASCGSCHSGYTATSVNKTLHLNGALDVNAMSCTSCHGTAGGTATAAAPLQAAPPADTAGASTGLRVGAHQKHLSGSAATKTYSNGFVCQACHASVGTYTATHSNGASDVGFTGATPATMAIGTFTPRSGTTAASCASTWCHAVKNRSGTSSGGTLQTPTWSGTITACTACHGAPPSTGQHSRSEHRSPGCGACHASYSATAVNKALHVNGVRDVGGTGTRINSWNTSTRTCSPSCHGSETW